MSKNETEELGRTHLKSKFMRESLLSQPVLDSSQTKEEVQILPEANIVAIGGKSIMDRGKKAVFPLVDEIAALSKKYKLILGVSGGVRVRHTYEIGMDLGLPTGGLAMITGSMEEQNAAMLFALMAKHRAIVLPKACFKELPLYLETGVIPILECMPPHHYWEKPPEYGILPETGADYGIYMVSEVLATRSMIYIKDVDGVFTDNPDKDPKAKHLGKIHVNELLKMDLNDLPIERSVVRMFAKSKRLHRIYVINGLKRGLLAQALEGKDVGTVIYNDLDQ